MFRNSSRSEKGRTSKGVYIVGSKSKGRISKRALQENKARHIFRKTNISCLLIRTRTCAYQGVRNVRFSENLVCFVFLVKSKTQVGTNRFFFFQNDFILNILKLFFSHSHRHHLMFSLPINSFSFNTYSYTVI